MNFTALSTKIVQTQKILCLRQIVSRDKYFGTQK